MSRSIRHAVFAPTMEQAIAYCYEHASVRKTRSRSEPDHLIINDVRTYPVAPGQTFNHSTTNFRFVAITDVNPHPSSMDAETLELYNKTRASMRLLMDDDAQWSYRHDLLPSIEDFHRHKMRRDG